MGVLSLRLSKFAITRRYIHLSDPSMHRASYDTYLSSSYYQIYIFHKKKLCTPINGRSQGGMQRVPMQMHPRDSVGLPRTSLSPMWSHHSKFSWDTYEASCIQMCPFEVLGAPTITNHSSWCPLEQAGAQEQ